jgi:hypothetical protein
MIGLLWQAGENAIGACDLSVWVRVVLSPRWGLSVSHFPHGLRRGLHSYAALRLKLGLTCRRNSSSRAHAFGAEARIYFAGLRHE